MGVEWHEAGCGDFIAALLSGECRHVGFMVGSVTSCGQPSSCLSVGEIRRGTIAAMLNLTGDKPRGRRARDLLLRVSQDLMQGNGALWHDVLRDLPFEQFMACVEHASSESAHQIARLLCGTGLSNTNHNAIAQMALRVLDLRLADQVTIVTTNYDMCLDEALRAVLGDETEECESQPVPFLPHKEFSTANGRVHYLKLHGCISMPSSLVFSFGQMLRLLTAHDWDSGILDRLGGTAATPSLVLTVGYGFWDRDLDVFLSRWLQNSSIFRNDPYLASGQHRTPTQVLQSEFFTQLCNRPQQDHAAKNDAPRLCVLRTPLLRDPSRDGSSMVSILQEACLALDLLPGEVPVTRCETDDANRFVGALADRWSLESTGEFLGRLCHCAERKDGRRITLSLLGDLLPAERGVGIAHEYFRSIGVRDARKRAVTCARMMRRRRSWSRNVPQTAFHPPRRLPRDVRAVAWAYESFMVSLMVGQIGSSKIKKASFGFRAFLADRLAWLNGIGQRHAQSILAEYSTHFWVKSAQQLPIPGLGRLLVRSMRRRVDALAVGGDLDQYGDAAALLAELLIDGGIADGVEWAATARRLRTIIGRYSNAAQGDRLLGWGYLAQGDSTQAAASFGRGLLLVLNGEPGVERKLGANLARVPWSIAHPWLCDLEPANLDPEVVRSAIRRVVTDGSASISARIPFEEAVSQRIEEWKTLFRHVLYTFEPNCRALVAELNDLQDTRRHCVYYPQCEPPM